MPIEQVSYDAGFEGLVVSHEQRNAILQGAEIQAIKIGLDQVITKLNEDIRKDGSPTADTLRQLASVNRYCAELVSRAEAAGKVCGALVASVNTRIRAAIGS